MSKEPPKKRHRRCGGLHTRHKRNALGQAASGDGMHLRRKLQPGDPGCVQFGQFRQQLPRAKTDLQQARPEYAARCAATPLRLPAHQAANHVIAAGKFMVKPLAGPKIE